MEDHNYYLPEHRLRERELLLSRSEEELNLLERTKVYLGVAFSRWTTLKRDKCFGNDAEVACFLLDSYERGATSSAASIKEKSCKVILPARSGTASSSEGINRQLYVKLPKRVERPPLKILRPADLKVVKLVSLIPSPAPAVTRLTPTQVRRDLNVQNAPPEQTTSVNQQVFHQSAGQEERRLKEEQEERRVKEELEERRIKEELEERQIKIEQVERHIKEEPEERQINQEQEERRMKEEPEERSIKEEPEERQINQEQEEPRTTEERVKRNVTRFPFTSVPVKGKRDKRKHRPSQPHQSPAEDNWEEELPASSSGKRIKAGSEDRGGRGQARVSYLDRCLPPNETASDFSENEGSANEDDGVDHYWQEPLATSGPETESSCSEDYCNWQEPLSDSGTETVDSDNSWTESRTPESGVNAEVECGAGKRSFGSAECGEQLFYRKPLQRHVARRLGERPSTGLAEPDASPHVGVHTREKSFYYKFVKDYFHNSKNSRQTRDSAQERSHFLPFADKDLTEKQILSFT